MKIMCVCGMGMGSSLIAKMNIESILKKLNLDAEIDNCDVGSVPSEYDWYVTTQELYDTMPSELKERTIVLHDFISVDKIEDKLKETLL